MLTIRLQRTGKKNEQHFRVAVMEKARSAKGKAMEVVGFLNPRKKERAFKKERILHWISQGAQPSDTVHNLLVTEKIIEGAKIAKHKIVVKKETPAAEAPVAPAAAVQAVVVEEAKASEVPAVAEAPAAEETKESEVPAA